MNICTRYQCDTCDTLIDCRIGMSNRQVQPFQFACPECNEQITFTLGLDDLEGATEIKDFEGLFSGENPFIDLHLDFPVSFGNYEQGNTAFMRVIHSIGQDSYRHLFTRLDLLNRLSGHHRNLRRLISQYKRGDIKAFEKVVKSLTDLEFVKLKSHKQEDVIAALYSATSIMSSPLTVHEHNTELSKGMPKLLFTLYSEHNDNLNAFFDSILKTGFLKTVHHDCISLYPKLIKLELPLRPALYYDYSEEDLGNVPARVSTESFDTCNNTYKDLAEVYSRQLVLVAGLNNLIHRGDFNLFSDEIRISKKNDKVIKEFSSLAEYANVDLGRKLAAIDNSFFNFDEDAIDTRLRNGIAHYKYEYDEANQIITYSSAKEGLTRDKTIEMSFMLFLRKMLLLFREVHSLNHVIKALLYHCVLVLKKEV
ncbi:TPA: hypothetical protein NJ265_000793 [Vibrio parahaemolyticus]|nr:hypothetical protein CGI88_07125 [Vibrio parahaemolyticus]TOR04556.1 hypothetical protein CGG81_19335 [Vibrio parahaemolyticus]HCE1826253.1 hypothetical protein [Vibrio parahaemolyticus]HCE5184045.1 hypothetical protein [Vibrio parahaemolyticus]HCG5605196.1 hypothetical protein [Vibrio parahaemolyticus]